MKTRELPEIDEIFRLGQESALGLSAFRQLLEEEALLPSSPHIFHVAGTNGKGSTSHFLARGLERAGLSTLLLTSPHLVRYNERFLLNSCRIAEERLAAILRADKHKRQTMNFPELTLYLGLRIAKEEQPDAIVIETGLGGRLDPSNAVEATVSVITSIGFDHCDILGSTLREIAVEKVGIVKSSSPLVTGVTQPELLSIFADRCNEVQSSLHQTKERYREEAGAAGFLGYQVSNCALALTALEIGGIESSATELVGQVGGRLHSAGEFLIDGAHNSSATDTLVESVGSERFRGIIFAVSQRKDWQKMLSALRTCTERLILTEAGYKPVNPSHMTEEAVRLGFSEVSVASDLTEAIKHSAKWKDPGRILVTGSMFLAGEAASLLTEDKRQ